MASPETGKPGARTAHSATTLRELPLFFVLAALIGWFAITAPGFFNPINLASVSRDAAVIGILGLGLTVVVITGGIDLSCASILALSACIMGILMDRTGTIFLPAVACVAVAGFLGAGNGFLVGRLGVPPIVATLATLSLYRMQAMKMVKLISPLPSGFRALGSGWNAFAALLVALVVMMLVLSRTRWGRRVYAVGGNSVAARLSGIHVGWTVGWTYVVSGLLAGGAALLASATLNSVQGTMFMGYELDAVAAVVIGGTSIAGGRGGVLGTALGAAIMSTLRNGLIVAGMSVYWYQAIIGCAILLVAGLDYALNRMRERGQERV